MSKFATALKILRILVRNPKQLTRVIDGEAEFRDHVAGRYGFKSGLPKIDLLDLLPGFHETVDPYSFLEGGSLPTDLALLKGLVRKYKLTHYLEIGTWRGESIANVASVATKCISLRLSDEEMKQKGYSDDVIAVHEFFSKGL